MQTFLPYKSFVKSAQVLDNKRLGKQRVEAYQILRILLGESKGWANHPAVKQWKDYEYQLLQYGGYVCSEWIQRGFKDTVLEKLSAYSKHFLIVASSLNEPSWLGNRAYHASHKSNLLRKDPTYYGQFKWNVPANLPYVWPSHLKIGG